MHSAGFSKCLGEIRCILVHTYTCTHLCTHTYTCACTHRHTHTHLDHSRQGQLSHVARPQQERAQGGSVAPVISPFPDLLPFALGGSLSLCLLILSLSALFLHIATAMLLSWSTWQELIAALICKEGVFISRPVTLGKSLHSEPQFPLL